MFCKKGVLKNFAKFTGKHLCQSLFFNKVASLRPTTLSKESLWHRCTFFYRTPPVAASVNTNWGLGASKYKLRSGAAKYKLVPGQSNTNWDRGPGPGPGTEKYKYLPDKSYHKNNIKIPNSKLKVYFRFIKQQPSIDFLHG